MSIPWRRGRRPKACCHAVHKLAQCIDQAATSSRAARSLDSMLRIIAPQSADSGPRAACFPVVQADGCGLHQYARNTRPLRSKCICKLLLRGHVVHLPASPQEDELVQDTAQGAPSLDSPPSRTPWPGQAQAVVHWRLVESFRGTRVVSGIQPAHALWPCLHLHASITEY